MTMRCFRMVCAVGFVSIVSLPGILLGQKLAIAPSSDADAVRATYAKLVFAVRLQDLRDLGSADAGATPSSSTAPLKITLSPITTGPISEITSMLMSDLVTKPSGATLSVTPGTWTLTVSSGQQLHAAIAHAQWTTSDYLAEDWRTPINNLIKQGAIEPFYTSYASFSVRLSYQGTQRQYKALFLFGVDPSGAERILPVDHIVGLQALLAIIDAPVTPDPLLAEPYRSNPEVTSFVNSLRAPSGCSMEPRTQMCCDSATEQCGVSAGALQMHGFGALSPAQSLTVHPLCANCAVYNTSGTPDPRTDGQQKQDHISGFHSGSATFVPVCIYSGGHLPCRTSCQVHIQSTATTEQGLKTLYSCHARPSSETVQDSQGQNTCSASWGYAAVGCLTCLCNASVTVGFAGANGSASVTVGGSGSPLWTFGASLITGPCPPRT
jgi:hypothetical protein